MHAMMSHFFCGLYLETRIDEQSKVSQEGRRVHEKGSPPKKD